MIGNPIFLRLPRRFRWTLHNIAAHPLCEILWQIGSALADLGRNVLRVSDWVHEWTIPLHDPEKEGRG